ncbi:MAG: MATE family efflux transporter [bacterium]|nr:MATE family efflux transporter [bacterium]
MAVPVPALGLDPTGRRRRVVTLAAPAIGEMVLHMFIWIVDTAMVGRLGAVALSAVGLGGHVYFTAAFILGALGTGVTAMVARSVGAGDTAAAGRIARQGLVLAAGLGITLGAGIYCLAGPLYSFTGLGPEATVLGTGYTRILATAAPVLLLGVVANAALRATGNTRLPLLAALLGNLVNGVGDYLLIFGVLGFPRLEVTGAAIAAVLGQVVAAAVSLAYLLSARSGLTLAGRGLDLDLVRRLGRLSLPTSAETTLLDGGRVVCQLIVTSLGATAFAAHQVAVAAESLSFMPGYGFAIAASILAGQSLGAGLPGEVRAYTREAVRLAGAIMSGMGVIFLLAATGLIRLFTLDPAVVALGSVCLRISAFAQPAIAFTETHNGALRGAGDTRSPMWASAIGIWGFRVPATYLAIRHLGMDLRAVWAIMVVEWMLRAVLVGTAFARGRWERVRV